MLRRQLEGPPADIQQDVGRSQPQDGLSQADDAQAKDLSAQQLPRGHRGQQHFNDAVFFFLGDVSQQQAGRGDDQHVEDHRDQVGNEKAELAVTLVLQVGRRLRDLLHVHGAVHQAGKQHVPAHQVDLDHPVEQSGLVAGGSQGIEIRADVGDLSAGDVILRHDVESGDLTLLQRFSRRCLIRESNECPRLDALRDCLR